MYGGSACPVGLAIRICSARADAAGITSADTFTAAALEAVTDAAGGVIGLTSNNAAGDIDADAVGAGVATTMCVTNPETEAVDAAAGAKMIAGTNTPAVVPGYNDSLGNNDSEGTTSPATDEFAVAAIAAGATVRFGVPELDAVTERAGTATDTLEPTAGRDAVTAEAAGNTASRNDPDADPLTPAAGDTTVTFATAAEVKRTVRLIRL